MKFNHLETFLETARSGTPALGCCVTLGDPAVSEIAAAAEFDFCWIDGEHGILDRQEIQCHLMALGAGNCAPLVRVPCNDHTEIKKVIDLAPAGIIVPFVTSAEEAEKAVAACRYPPEGNRGYGFRRGIRYGADPVPPYWELSRREPLVILQIEDCNGVADIDRILSVPGIDSILIGPYDLSASLGKPGDFADPELNAVLDTLCEKVRKAGLLLGAYAESSFERWRTRGIHYLGIANDTSSLLRQFRNLKEIAANGLKRGV